MDKAAVGKIKKYIILAAVILGVYIGFKYLSPLVTPFLFAFVFVALVHPFLERFQSRFHIKKGFLTAAILLLLCLSVGTLIWFAILWGLKEMGEVLGMLNTFEEKFSLFLKNCCDGVENKFGFDGDGIETFILEKVNLFIENFQVQIVPKLMNESVGYMKSIVSVVSFMAIAIIAAVLLAKDYADIVHRLKRHSELFGILEIGKKVFRHVGTFIKAQLIILSVISILCGTVLYFSGIEGGLILGLFTGVMDMLPFIGTGLILIPLAFWQILCGELGRAVLCFFLYIACALTREFLEPKLIGEKVGVFPVAILFSVYVGVKLFGLTGILKGPLALITIFEILNYLREQRREEKCVVKEERTQEEE